MEATRRHGLRAQQRAELWRRWKEGQSLSDIGRALGKGPSSVFLWVSERGGIAPRSRSRSSRVLAVQDREEISRGICQGESIRRIAARIGKAPSTVSREITRNGGRCWYRATQADLRAWRRAQRPKVYKLARHRGLQRIVAKKLQLDWSPEQIAGWLRYVFPSDTTMQVSHETIYRSLFMQARGVLKQELVRHLRSRRLMRHAKSATTPEAQCLRIADAVSIRERPPEVEDRCQFAEPRDP